jgi:hypothetical protein
MRFIKWQISSRFIPEVIVYARINGSRFIVKNGETRLSGDINTDLHEFPDMVFCSIFFVMTSLIDIGANTCS